MFRSKIIRPVLYQVCRTVTKQPCPCDAPGGAGSGPISKSVDPIQQSFIARLREYRQKSEKSPNGLADATPKEEKELNEMLAKVDRIFGAEGKDMTQFPTFKFEEPKIVMPSSSLNIEYPKDPEDTA